MKRIGIKNRAASLSGFIFLTLLMAAGSARAVSSDKLYTTVTVTNSPSPQTTFTWDMQASGATVAVLRRDLGLAGTTGTNGFATVATVNYPTNTYTDASITSGKAYEYRLLRLPFSSYQTAAAYIAVTVEAPLEDSRGTVLLVVDNSLLPEFTNELSLLELDLAGDGWKVNRLDFAPNGVETPQDLKAAIVSAHMSDPTINALYLFGNLPVARSGMMSPDGHSPSRAHETDLYYADLDGLWTDTTLNVDANGNGGQDLEIDNIPGDGKWDQSNLPSEVELMTGRVDFNGMTAYHKSGNEYLRDYIQKSHTWRTADHAVPYRGLINNDNYLNMESSWLRPMFNPNSTYAAFQPTLNTEAYLWAVAFPNFDGTSADYVDANNKAMFTISFGSYKQMWARQNNPMRALLCQPDWGLTCAWGARPAWFFHHMAAGKPVGYSAMRTENNDFNGKEYYPEGNYSFFGKYISMNLMGDPTLRMHPVLPAKALVASGSGTTANLTWSSSTDSTRIGFHVYRSTSRLGDYTRLTSSPLAASSTNYTDNAKPAGEVYYQVRAVARTTVPTGTFFNQSQGVFTLLHDNGTGNAIPVADAPTALQTETAILTPISFPGSDANGDTLTPIVTFNPTNGLLHWSNGQASYISNDGFTGSDSFTYRLFDGLALSEPVTRTVTVSAVPDPLLEWEFLEKDQLPSPAYQSPLPTMANSFLQPVSLTNGPGCNIVASDYYNNDGYAIENANSASLDLNDYISWTVAPVSGKMMSLHSIVAGAFGYQSGDEYSVALRCSTDGFATYDEVPLSPSNPLVGGGWPSDTGTETQGLLSGLSDLQNTTNAVEFRFYLWDAAPYFTIGIGRLGATTDDLIIRGTVNDAGAVGDADNDGLPDWFETQYYGGATNANPAAMASNGVNTVLEAYIAGLDPTDPTNLFTLSGTYNALEWNAISGRVYTIYWATNLMDGFQLLSNGLHLPGTYTDSVHSAESAGFYKMDVQLEP